MKKKPLAPKLTKKGEYRTPKTIPWERTAELYGEQAMSLGGSKVKDFVNLGRDK